MSQEGQASAEKAPASPHPTPPALCVPVPREKVLQDFQVLVQKVGGRPEVLLIGETLEGQGIHGLMASFVKDLFSAPCQPVHPGDILKEPLPTPCSVGGRECQLVFFLCRASCLKGKQGELQKVLAEVKRFVQKSPCALVGILMEPKKGEAEAARAQLLRLLRGVFPKPPGQRRAKQTPNARTTKGGSDKPGSLELEDIEVEAEIYVPGQPRGNLAIMKAACRASEALAKSRGVSEEGSKEHPLTVAGSSPAVKLLKGLLGAACLAGALWASWQYISEYGLIPPRMMPSDLLIFA
ncbi:hypothetical protein JRQ81_008233 [Phrynocephalus forsythii]|uniref:Uncharacterized protein n=1 Tax=Phrynocephalus forsythii TaxID=171643 RepID=A0A9Q0XBH9_9SAUR|nr:hypothetical protein JRQ81_008233 [Phrynocephalus forsythii]